MVAGKQDQVGPAVEPAERGEARGPRRKRRGLGALSQRLWQQGVPEMVLLPRRAVFVTAEVVSLCDVKTATLRRWERLFPQVSPGKDDAGQRQYTRGQVELVLRIKQLYEREELPVAEVRRRLAEAPLQKQAQAIESKPRAVQAVEVSTVDVERALQQQGAALPDSAVSFLRAELSALVDLCQDEPEQLLPAAGL